MKARRIATPVAAALAAVFASFMLRASMALLSLWVMFYPDARAAWAGALLLLPATILAVARHRRIAPPKDEPRPQHPMKSTAAAVAQR